MLKVMRDSFHQLKWVLLAVVAAFIFGFVFIDMGLGGAASAEDSEQAFAARVNGSTISYREYDRALYFTEENYKRTYGQALTPEMYDALGIHKQVLDSLIEQRLLLQEADRLELTATPEEIRKKILEIPALNPDGKFVGTELYTRYVTGRLGYQNVADFEEEVAREITLTKIDRALLSAIMVSPKAAEIEYKRMAENSKIRYVLVPSSREAAQVTITPAEVESYYKANQAKYAHGEQRNLKYLLADYNRLRSQIVPTDAEIRARYEADKEQYRTNEAARVQHILIKVDPGATPEAEAAAKAKAEQIVAQLRGGADFASLARQHSGDPSSSAGGGDMGWVERGQTVAPFDQAIFSLPEGQISDPIRSQEYGFHIVRVDGRRPGGFQDLEQVRAQIASTIAEERSKQQARDDMNRLSAQLKQQKPASAEQFATLANDKITSNDTQWFGKNDQIPGVGFNAPLSTWAFSAKPGDVGELMATQRGIVIPYLVGVRPAGVSPLEEVRARVETDVRNEKAREIARNNAARALQGAASVDAVATRLGLTASDTTATQQGYISGISGDVSALIKTAFDAKPGQMVGPVPVQDGVVVFQVVEQKKVTPQEIKDNATAYEEALRNQQGRALRTALLQQLRKEAKIEVNQRILQSRQQNA